MGTVSELAVLSKMIPVYKLKGCFDVVKTRV